nr:acyl-CoA thioesterase domain-containing protein [Rhodococcus wratislaviensis]
MSSVTDDDVPLDLAHGDPSADTSRPSRSLQQAVPSPGSTRRIPCTATSFTLSASFKLPEVTPDRQPVMPAVPPPEELPDPYEAWSRVRPDEYRDAVTARVMSMRFVPSEDVDGDRPLGIAEQFVWLEPAHSLPDDPLMHVCALTYGSDMTLASTAALDRQPHRSLQRGPSRVFMTSLDHAVWFHRPFRADDWMLFAQQSPSAVDGRGLSMGNFWTRDGHLVATVVQESLMRPVRRIDHEND